MMFLEEKDWWLPLDLARKYLPGFRKEHGPADVLISEFQLPEPQEKKTYVYAVYNTLSQRPEESNTL